MEGELLQVVEGHLVAEGGLEEARAAGEQAGEPEVMQAEASEAAA